MEMTQREKEQELRYKIQGVYGLTHTPKRTPFQTPDWGYDPNLPKDVRIIPSDIAHLGMGEKQELIEELLKRGSVGVDGYITLMPGDVFWTTVIQDDASDWAGLKVDEGEVLDLFTEFPAGYGDFDVQFPDDRWGEGVTEGD